MLEWFSPSWVFLYLFILVGSYGMVAATFSIILKSEKLTHILANVIMRWLCFLGVLSWTGWLMVYSLIMFYLNQS